MEQNNKEIWVFLSHSNEDYDKVRLVRNILEEQHMRPIMFFLKCLNDDDEEEIFSLIKREIDSRTRFILCDSPNARKSTWVQREVGYMKQKERRFQTIDLTKSEEEISRELISYKEKSRVFISYAFSDRKYGESLAERLRKYDFFVFPDMTCLNIEISVSEIIKSTKTSGGIFISLVSKRYLKSEFCYREFVAAIDAGCNILPLAIEELSLHDLGWMENYNFKPYRHQDNAIESVLRRLFDLNSILIFANEFHKGSGREKDLKEAEFCFNIYRRQNENRQDHYGALSLARCYSHGRGTDIDLVKSYDYYEKTIMTDWEKSLDADEIEHCKKEMLNVYNRMSEEEKSHVRKYFPEQQ